MYEPPIKIVSYENLIKDVSAEIENQFEKEISEVFQRYGIVVDREELIKALRYDRNQYVKGYNDALKHVSKSVSELVEGFMFKIEEDK